MLVMCAVLSVRVTRAARVNELSGAQNGTSIFPFPVALWGARSARRKLFAHIVGQRQATACASVAIRASQWVQSLLSLG
jgi:hypothetical protein